MMIMLQKVRFLILCFVPLFPTLCFCYEARNPEVAALIAVKNGLDDPHGAFSNWDEDSVDPCSWARIICSPDNLVTGLGAPSQGLSGTLSEVIANLINLRQVLLQNNNISGQIPAGIGHLKKLQTLDLSNNKLTGHVPESLSLLTSLQYLRLNNNRLSVWSYSLVFSFCSSTCTLICPVPEFSARTFNIVGNNMICGSRANEGCYGSTLPEPLSFELNSPSGKGKSKRVAIALGISLGCLVLLVVSLGVLLWKRSRNKKQSVLDINGMCDFVVIYAKSNC
uniref:Putative leucine-rich repeat protein, plant-type n=1 Tax=Helianthus annuus TaxID=4232 RepID=A0A251RWW3_HELAN